jgi:hypothetical protein
MNYSYAVVYFRKNFVDEIDEPRDFFASVGKRLVFSLGGR